MVRYTSIVNNFRTTTEMANCQCYVKTLEPGQQFSLRYGAHALDCPVYRVSRDPLDRRRDQEARDSLGTIVITSEHLAFILSIVREHKRNPMKAKEIQSKMDTRFCDDKIHRALWERILIAVGV